ncbi:MAG: ABC transporter ATP-binding protein [Lachnospiraceae bacterium]|nr:ABC transporter ATP-binding protein [Lachnospiraceae bacterium]
MGEKETAVKISNLNKYFADLQVLSDISLDVKKGEFISVIGVSGCGKSTLIRIIGGLETLTDGEVLVNGETVKKPSRKVGFVFQDHRLLPWLTVEDNIKLALEKGTKDTDEIVDKYLKLVGLESFKKAYPTQLSGGMAQRVAIARALANQPDILLLDEPFGALDAITRISMQQELQKIWKKENITMILITHDIAEAVFLGERVVVMSSRPGRVKDIIPVDAVCHYQRTGSDFARTRDRIYQEFFRDEEMPFAYNI